MLGRGRDASKAVGEDVSEKFIRIGELARITRTTARTLRFYEELGLIAPAQRSAGGFRLYSKEAIETVAVVRSLTEAGFSLKEVSRMMELWVSSATGKERHQLLTVVLLKRLGDIRGRIDALEEVERKLESFLRHLEACRVCPEPPGEEVCVPCGKVEEKPLEALLSISWKTKANKHNLSNSSIKPSINEGV